ncbi:MAG: protease inhibitor I42 family protein [Candidatus Omnitrophota bacterium]
MPEKKLTIISLILVAALFGCAVPKEIMFPVKGSRTVGVRKGQVLKLQFDANASTGYIWELADSANKGVIEQVGKIRYIHTSNRIGAPGIQIFRCEGMKKGKAALTFEYRRPWEKDAKPAKRYVVRVLVT